MNNDKTIDVLIIGAGPAGSALAIDLARRGLDIRIIEKAPHAFDGSRAKGIQPRTLEVFQDLDVLHDTLAAGSEYPKLGIHLGPLTVPWRIYPHRQPSADIPFPNTWLIPQYHTDRALHARLGRLGRSVEFETELIELTQGTETVTATVAGADGLEEITSRYVVGADGGSSSVRKQLGITFAGSTDEKDRMVIIDAATTGLSRDWWHVWPGLRGRFTGMPAARQRPVPVDDPAGTGGRAPARRGTAQPADPLAHPQRAHHTARHPVDLGLPAQHPPGRQLPARAGLHRR